MTLCTMCYLPDDALLEIFKLTDVKTLANLRLTCKRFETFIDRVRKGGNNLPSRMVSKIVIRKSEIDSVLVKIFYSDYRKYMVPKKGFKQKLRCLFGLQVKQECSSPSHEFQWNAKVELTKLMGHFKFSGDFKIEDGQIFNTGLVSQLTELGPQFVDYCRGLSVDFSSFYCNVNLLPKDFGEKLVATFKPGKLKMTATDDYFYLSPAPERAKYYWILNNLLSKAIENPKHCWHLHIDSGPIPLHCLSEETLLPFATKDRAEFTIICGNTNLTVDGIFRLVDVNDFRLIFQ